MAAVLVLLGTGAGPNHAAQATARLAAFGDSYVNPGVFGFPKGERPWLPLLGLPVRNFGHAGDGVGQTLSRTPVATRTTYDVVVLEVGINDVRRFGADPARLAAFRSDYEQVLRRLSFARRVVVIPPLPVTSWGRRGSEAALVAYRLIESEVAAQRPNTRVADPLPAWHPETMLLPDGLHPDALGRAVIAAAVRDALAVP